MKIAFVGCGFVADYYKVTLANHPRLDLVGVYDRDPGASKRFGDFFSVPVFSSLDELLSIPGLELVVNLTTPESHYAVSKAALEAGLHVYSEKPLAMTLEDAEDLAALARTRRRLIASAPCSHQSDVSRALRAEIASGSIGAPRLVYAEMEDGMVFRDDHVRWRSLSGAPWPGLHEFEVGATIEHAGYGLTWLCAYFGPVRRMTAFSALAFEDKRTGQRPEALANDFSVACLTFDGGIVARLTCGLGAPRDRSIHVIGTEGMLTLPDSWDNASPIFMRDVLGRWPSSPPILGKVLKRIEEKVPGRFFMGRRVRSGVAPGALPDTNSRMDFAKGLAVMEEAVREGRELDYGADFALHVTEVTLAIQYADRHPQPYEPRTSFVQPREPRRLAA